MGDWDAFQSRVIAATRARGRGFARVTHPTPEAAVICGEWDIVVEIGPEQI